MSDEAVAGGRLVALLRTGYGAALRTLPPRQADRLRGLVARHRHHLPGRSLHHRRVRVPGPQDNPVALLVATGCDDARLEALRRHLAGWPVRTVWVVDTDEPGRLADRVVEWLPPAADLARAGMDATAVRAARLGLLVERYRPGRIVIVPPTGPLPDAVLVAAAPTDPTLDATGGAPAGGGAW